MKNKIYAFIVAVTLFVSINNISSAAEQQNLKVGKIEFSHLRELPEDYLLSKIPVKSGDDYSNKSMSDIYLALKKLNYVDNVSVIPEINGDTVNLRVEVSESANASATLQNEERDKALSQKTEFVISKIDIVGTKTISKEELLSGMKIKEGQQFVPKEALNEAQRIFNTGYFATVEPKIDRKADNTVVITYEVKENPDVTGIEITGNTLFTDDQLKQALGIKEGQILNGNLLNPDKNGIIKLYEKNGYATARIESINVGEDGKIKIGMTEGVVQNVTFSKASSKTDDERANPKRANLRTKSYVLERYLEVKPGEVLEGKNIESTMKEMYRTGIFNRIEPNITGSETDPNARNVEFLIEERPTTTINGSISYGTSVGLVGGLKLSDDNFLGRDQQAAINLEASNKGDKTFSIDWFDPWIKNTERVQAGGSAYWRESRDDDADWDELEKVKTIGTRWTIGKGLNKDIYVRASTRLDHKKEIYSGGDVKDSYNLLAITPEFIYDTRDNVSDPTKGLYADLTYEKGKLLGDRRKYDRFEADLRAFHPVIGKKNIMAYRAVWGSTGSGTPDSMRFSVGGAESVRGYEYGAFDGYDQFYASIENRTRFGKNGDVQLVAFFDIGNAWQKESINAAGRRTYSPDRKSAHDFKDLKKGYGVGLRINTPVGPLRFDYGWPMDPEKPGKKKDKGKFYFSFGQSF
jgi:surface antigen